MRSAVTIFLRLVLAGAILTGCSESRKPHQDIPQKENSSSVHQDTAAGEAETETTEKSTQMGAEYEDNFAVDRKAAKEFAEKVKTAAANKDLAALADLTAFPVYVGLPNTGAVKTREDFLKLGAETVFTEEPQI